MSKNNPFNKDKSEKPKDTKKTLFNLIHYMGKYKYGFIAVVIFCIGSTIFTIVGPKILGNATTEVFNGIVSKIQGTGGINFEAIGGILITLLILYLISFAFGCTQGIIASFIAQKLCHRMRSEICKKIHRLPMNYFDKHTNGEILSIVTNDIDTIGINLNQSVVEFISATTLIVGIAIMMFSINWIMALVALIILPVSLAFMSSIVKRSQKYFKQQQDYLGHINGKVEETFGGEVVVKAFNNQENEQEKFKKMNDTLFSSAWKSQFMSGLMMPVMQFFGNVGYVIVAVLGSWLAINGVITIGNIQSFIQYIRLFTEPIMELAQIANMFQSTAAAAERVFVFLDEEEEKEESQNPVSTDKLTGSVQFDHVNFGYSPDKIIINDFSTDVKPGQKIAIVGPTGAGKTTIVRLLMRFYDLNGGAIKLDGHDINDFTRNDLRKMFGMVLQDSWLYSGTIMENIRYGNLNASDADVYAAAKAAHVDHFIRTQSEGYDTILNEDATNISQGQRQLLTIARAILSDPKILILDEATSSVDTRTEILIQKAMDNLMRGRTSFVIAHRLSTIKDADIILVMKDGDVIEQGSHNALMEQHGFYEKLYSSQFDNTEDETA